MCKTGVGRAIVQGILHQPLTGDRDPFTRPQVDLSQIVGYMTRAEANSKIWDERAFGPNDSLTTLVCFVKLILVDESEMDNSLKECF